MSGQTFQFQPLVDIVGNESAALGADNTHKLVSADVGKPVKIAAAENYVLCATGDEIEGTVETVQAFTVNNGFSFGTVSRRGRRVATQTGATTVVVGDLLVADTNAALGVLNTAAICLAGATLAVKKGVPTKFLWRVISLLGGGGLQNTNIVIERINA
jgi:hypothetical protein